MPENAGLPCASGERNFLIPCLPCIQWFKITRPRRRKSRADIYGGSRLASLALSACDICCCYAATTWNDLCAAQGRAAFTSAPDLLSSATCRGQARDPPDPALRRFRTSMPTEECRGREVNATGDCPQTGMGWGGVGRNARVMAERAFGGVVSVWIEAG